MSTKELISDIASEDYAVNGFFCDIRFKKDVCNLITIRKMIRRFIRIGVVNDKLLINNVVIAVNAFGVSKVNRMLRIILSDDEFAIAKSILLFLCCYCLWDVEVESNRIMDAILSDTALRYNLEKLNDDF